MKTPTAPLTLNAYKEASRDELEAVIDRFARIEQAADLRPGSLVDGLLGFIRDADAEEVISYIEGGYELAAVPDDWRERVEAVLK